MSKLNQYLHKGDFILESGEKIHNLIVAYHTFGQVNSDASNIIWVFHALSANSNVMEWWPGLFGDACLFNSEDHYIVCANVIGSPYGSTQALDKGFPQFSVRDVVAAHLLLASHLEINKIKVAIGGSFGGDQALEFAYSYEGIIENLVLIASSAKESAWAIAIHETQRIALTSDPTFGKVGGGVEGMKAARAIGMLTYRTSRSFIENQTDNNDKIDQFKASSYIQYQGDKFVKRFNALSYYFLTKCLDSHNIGRNRGGENLALRQIRIPTLVIGISSDILIPTSLQKELAKQMPNAVYKEIESTFGHDGFLVETKSISDEIFSFLNSTSQNRKVLKFGGKSLANGKAFNESMDIVLEASKHDQIVMVASARGQATDRLIGLYRKALKNELNHNDINDFINDQLIEGIDINFEEEKMELESILNSISVLGFDHQRIKDQVVSFGELMSVRTIAAHLRKKGKIVKVIDSREIIKTYEEGGETHVDLSLSKEMCLGAINNSKIDLIYIVTGFISSDKFGKTSTLGRNGSNYTATLLASFLKVKEVQNWTDVDGVYTGHPKYVKTAKRINHLSYKEANELANFGINVLHSKTILPLVEAQIPLRILSSFSKDKDGTLIDQDGSGLGIKAVSLIEDVSLISIEGSGMMGKVGIDSRIFSTLKDGNISVRLISQASTERSIGFVIGNKDDCRAEKLLNEEFAIELNSGIVSKIKINKQTAIISIIGRHNYALEKAIHGLRKNKIWVHLFSNSINGENISLVIDDHKKFEALNIVHEYAINNK